MGKEALRLGVRGEGGGGSGWLLGWSWGAEELRLGVEGGDGVPHLETHRWGNAGGGGGVVDEGGGGPCPK